LILKLSTDDLNTLKIPHVDEFLSQSGSNTLSQTRNDSITPNKEDELELKHRVIQGSAMRKSQKYDSATPSESSYKDNSDSDDDQMDFDDDIGEEVE